MHKKAIIKTAVLSSLGTIFLSSCSLLNTPLDEVSEADYSIFTNPLRDPKPFEEVNTRTKAKIPSSKTDANIKSAPALVIKKNSGNADFSETPKLPDLLVSRLTFNNMPVPAFINEIFSNQLNLDYVLGPSIGDIEDLVTMRLNNNVSHAELYSLA